MSDRPAGIVSGRGCEKWRPPTIDAPRPAPADGEQVTVAEVESIQEKAYQEGFQIGHQEGFDAARTQARRLNEILDSLADPVADLDESFMEQLFALVKAICGRLVRREAALDPGQIIPVIREAVDALPGLPREVDIHLHPEDAAVVREALAVSEENTLWRLIEDPGLARGDCRMINHHSRVDGTLEARLNAVMAQLMGGSRQGE